MSERERAMYRAARLGIALVVAALVAESRAMALAVPCGNASQPECAGTCPDGQICVTTSRFVEIRTEIAPTGTAPERNETGAANGDCLCTEVRCGGVLLDPDHRCCNGRVYTVGVEGCCQGQIVDVNAPCDCSSNLNTTACCEIDSPNGTIHSTFDVAQTACCQQPLSLPGAAGSAVTTYSLSSGLDCCPSTGDSHFCGGECKGSECETRNCCRCPDCQFGGSCAAGDFFQGCFAACALALCNPNAEIAPDAVCTANGCASEARAPAASRLGLLALVGALAVVALGGLARRRRTRNAITPSSASGRPMTR